MAKPKAHQHPGSGDVEITLGEYQLTLRPTLGAGLGISRQAGGIRGAIDKVAAMDLDTIVVVIRNGIGPEEVKRIKTLDRLIYESGLVDTQNEVMSKCLEFLMNLARGGRPAPAEPENEEDKVEERPTVT